MAKGTVNRVQIVGRLGKDPELRAMPSGMAVANISIATNDGYKDGQTGQFVDQVEWHRVSLFGSKAATLNKFVKKGDLLFVEGKLRTRKWQDNQSVEHYTTEIIATDMQMLGGANQNHASAIDGGSSSQEHAEAVSEQPKGMKPVKQAGTTDLSMAGYEDFAAQFEESNETPF